MFRLPSLSFAEALSEAGAEVFAYLFTWNSPFLGGILGSAHALEVPFVFGSVARASCPALLGLGSGSARAVGCHDALVGCVRSFGRPFMRRARAVARIRRQAKRHTMVLGEHRALEHDPRGEEREAWSDSGVDMANRLFQP